MRDREWYMIWVVFDFVHHHQEMLSNYAVNGENFVLKKSGLSVSGILAVTIIIIYIVKIW